MRVADEERPGPSVLVVGGGFAGVGCAKELAKHDVRVTLLDQHNYHQFQPLLYQVATAELSATDVGRPLRAIFTKDPTVDVKQVEVTDGRSGTRVGHDRRRRRRSPADYLVLAAGSRPNFFGTRRAPRSTRSRSTRVADASDAAHPAVRGLRGGRQRPRARIDEGALNIVIVGAGPTGVETAGAVADLVNDVMPERFHDLDVDAHPDLPRRPRPRRARRLLRQGPRLRGERSSSTIGVDPAARHRRRGGHGRPGRAERRHRDPDPHRGVGWRASRRRPSPASDGPARRAGADASTRRPDLDGRGLPAASTPSATWPTSPDADGNDFPQLGSVALQAGRWAADNILADIAGKPTHARSTTRTRASWP